MTAAQSQLLSVAVLVAANVPDGRPMDLDKMLCSEFLWPARADEFRACSGPASRSGSGRLMNRRGIEAAIAIPDEPLIDTSETADRAPPSVQRSLVDAVG